MTDDDAEMLRAAKMLRAYLARPTQDEIDDAVRRFVDIIRGQAVESTADRSG